MNGIMNYISEIEEFTKKTTDDIQEVRDNLNKEVSGLKKTINFMKIAIGITLAVAVAGLFTGCTSYHPYDCTCDDCNLAPLELLYSIKNACSKK